MGLGCDLAAALARLSTEAIGPTSPASALGPQLYGDLARIGQDLGAAVTQLGEATEAARRAALDRHIRNLRGEAWN